MNANLVRDTADIVSISSMQRRWRCTHNAMLPADPSPPPRFALLVVLSACAVVVQFEMAATSAVLSEAALTPPVHNFAMAALALGHINTDS
jgi:hypothetical protein